MDMDGVVTEVGGLGVPVVGKEVELCAIWKVSTLIHAYMEPKSSSIVTKMQDGTKDTRRSSSLRSSARNRSCGISRMVQQCS